MIRNQESGIRSQALTMNHPEEQEYPYWNRVYLAVIIVTIIVIAAMWLFSKSFE